LRPSRSTRSSSSRSEPRIALSRAATARAARAFVLRQTDLRPVPGLEAIRLHLAYEILPLWRAVQIETGDEDAPLPYWAFAWAGGLALAHYLRDEPSVVAGRRVLDLASGSGLCAIAAMLAGAERVTAVDIDPMAVAAADLNAKANHCRLSTVERDLLDEPPPDVDVIMAGDCWYETGMADRVTSWLRRAAGEGIEVVIGDPGRTYLPVDELVELARYAVRTTTVLEDLDQKTGYVFAFRDEAPRSSASKGSPVSGP
jgi:predicted nicotinamide N-methyase